MSKTISYTAEHAKSTWRVYLTLTKPKVVALMLLTALVGMCLAVPGALPVRESLFGLTGIGLMAGSAAAFNHLIDRRIDAIMARTYKRPLPSGDVNVVSVFVFATSIGVFGFGLLYAFREPTDSMAYVRQFARLRGNLHYVSQTSDTAKHCDRRDRRRYATTIGLDRCHRRTARKRLATGDDYLYLDAAAFLGARHPS